MKRSKKLLMLMIVFVLVFIAACSSSGGGKNEPSGNNTNTTNTNNTATNTANNNNNNETAAEEVIDPLGKYDPPIKMTMPVLRSAVSFVDGETDGDNRWTREYEEALGIEMDVVWAVPSDQYSERLGVTIATGDIPDVMMVDKVTLAQLVESDMVEDMTEVYEKYASDLLKSVLDLDGNGYAIKQATFDGRIMAIPTQSASLAGKMIHIRKDWLDNLNLQPPKTLADFHEIVRAFTHDDPDGNGVNDTFGLAANQWISAWNLDLEGFFNMYGAYPKAWVKGEDGKLVYGSLRKETRDALLKLQEMYKDGQLDQEFAVKTVNMVAEDGSAGKFGVAFGSYSTPISPFKNVKKLT